MVGIINILLVKYFDRRQGNVNTSPVATALSRIIGDGHVSVDVDLFIGKKKS